jgi:hypothetical protein
MDEMNATANSEPQKLAEPPQVAESQQIAEPQEAAEAQQVSEPQEAAEPRKSLNHKSHRPLLPSPKKTTVPSQPYLTI